MSHRCCTRRSDSSGIRPFFSFWGIWERQRFGGLYCFVEQMKKNGLAEIRMTCYPVKIFTRVRASTRSSINRPVARGSLPVRIKNKAPICSRIYAHLIFYLLKNAADLSPTANLLHFPHLLSRSSYVGQSACHFSLSLNHRQTTHNTFTDS